MFYLLTFSNTFIPLYEIKGVSYQAKLLYTNYYMWVKLVGCMTLPSLLAAFVVSFTFMIRIRHDPNRVLFFSTGRDNRHGCCVNCFCCMTFLAKSPRFSSQLFLSVPAREFSLCFCIALLWVVTKLRLRSVETNFACAVCFTSMHIDFQL